MNQNEDRRPKAKSVKRRFVKGLRFVDLRGKSIKQRAKAKSVKRHFVEGLRFVDLRGKSIKRRPKAKSAKCRTDVCLGASGIDQGRTDVLHNAMSFTHY